jgi:hypothetical protein
MKLVHFIPVDDVQTNHSLNECSCGPIVKKKLDKNRQEYLEIYHWYTDGKAYIKKLCHELGVSTPKFKYNQITTDAENQRETH